MERAREVLEFTGARTEAEQALAAARAAGDVTAAITALGDLGAACVRAGDAAHAIDFLEEALRLVKPLGDPLREADLLGNLALANNVLGKHSQAIGYLNQALALARSAGDRFEEKMALYRLGNVWVGLRDPFRAGTFYEQALPIAQAVGDRQHEADLNWQLAIINEEIGRHDQAILRAQMTVQILKEIAHPHAEWFAEHLQKFCAGDSQAGSQSGSNALAALTGALTPGATLAEPPAPPVAAGPGLLRMAYTAAKSLTKFLGSGLKTVPAEERQSRLQLCTNCEHHTGIRCRVCGCFTSAKTWLPHERCPLGKW